MRTRWYALMLALGAAACAPAHDAGPAQAAQTPPESATLPAAAPNPVHDPAAGTWWAVSERIPVRAFRISLQPSAQPDGPREGQWVSFDWRATADRDVLAHRSRPAAVTAQLEGETVTLRGPAPMLTEKGYPNGHQGEWELVLQKAHLPGEPERYAGVAYHQELAPRPEGAPFALEREFRPWSSRAAPP